MDIHNDAPAVYPDLPLPPSSRTYTYQPSAPPSAPSAPPSAPPSTPLSAPPSAPSPGQEPWSPHDRQPAFFSEPSAPPSYPILHHHYAYDYSPSYPRSALTPYHILPVKEPDARTRNVHVRPEPGLALQLLRDLYKNPFLNNLTQRLVHFERQSIIHTQGEDNAALFEHLKSYEAAHEAIQQSNLTLFQLEQKAKGYAAKLWVVQSKSEVAKATCGDGATISHTYTYQYGHHEPEMAAKLKKSLGRLFKQRTKSLIRMQFEETSSRLWIQDHLSHFLNGIQWSKKSGGNAFDARIPRDGGHDNEADLVRIRRYLDILFQFERSVRRQADFDAQEEERKASEGLGSTADEAPADDQDNGQPNSILRSIQCWSSLLATAILQHGDYNDYEYLVLQVLQSRQISGWAAPTFIQCGIPAVWSNTYQDFYLTQLQLVLCGTGRNIAGKATEGLYPEIVLKVGDSLNEDDYLAILDQLDVTLFLNRLLLEHKEMHTNDGSFYHREVADRSALRLFAATRHLFDVVILGLQRLIKLVMVTKRIAQLLCQLTQILGDHLLVLGPMSANKAMGSVADLRISHESGTSTTAQLELDHILLDVVKALLALPGHGVWTFMPSIPFKFMSSGTIVLLLEELALVDIEKWIAQPDALLSMAPESNKLRQTLGSNPGEAVFLLTSLANMAISRALQGTQSNHDLVMHSMATLEDSISSTIAFLLLDVAFLDSDIRGELAKPTREILATVCDSHPRVVSFMVRFVEMHFKEMGGMAQYLFREIPLDEWEISSEDLKVLIKFLETGPLGSAQALFARHMFNSLAWETKGDHGIDLEGELQARIPAEFRKELALTMADICIHHLRTFAKDTAITSVFTTAATGNSPQDQSATALPVKSPENNKFIPTFASSLPHAVANLAAHSGMNLSTEQAALKSFMDWCWSMIPKLCLAEIEPLSVVEASRLHVQDPGLAKYPLFSQGQLTFVHTVHLLLTQASRDPKRFLVEGWSTLSAVLQAGMGTVFMDLVAKLVPPVMFFGTEMKEHVEKMGLLLREMAAWKQDPLLATAGLRFADLHGLEIQSVVDTKIPKEVAGFWTLLQFHLAYGQKMDPETGVKTVLQFWLSAAFSQRDWMAHQEYVQVLDVVCSFCFLAKLDSFIKDALMEQQILLSIGFRQSPGVQAELMGLAQPSLDRVMQMLPERFLKALPVPQGSSDPSLLMGTWSVRSFATTLLTQQAMVESSSIWFAYYALSIETHLERDMRIKTGHYFLKHPEELKANGNIKAVLKTMGVTSRKTLQNFSIWRWAQHLLILPLDTFLLPLFWQMFFYLYFGHAKKQHQRHSGRQQEQQQQDGDVFYGFKFLETSPEMVEQLKDRLQQTYAHFGQAARKAIQEHDLSQAGQLTLLHEFYIALYGWISEPLLLTAEIDLKRIRKDLMADRLGSCRLSDPFECSADLWRDLLFDRTTSGTVSQNGSSPTRAVATSRPSPVITRMSSGISTISLASPSSSRSWDQARVVRKHGHAWQEQKISQCLVRQSKPAPDFFVPRVLIPVICLEQEENEEYQLMDPQSLFGQLTRTLKDYCRLYRETNAAHENLDAAYLKELSGLYHNETKTTSLRIACDTTPNALCKMPAAIELKYEEIVLNEAVKRQIVENRERAQGLGLGQVETELCLTTLEILKTVRVLLDLLAVARECGDLSTNTKSHHRRKGVLLHHLAVQSFYFLQRELLPEARAHPPTHMFLSEVVDTLGMQVVAKDPNQTEPILDLMGTDDFTISMVCKTFYPAALMQEFVRLYQRVATCKDYSLASKDRLLRQFDVQAWACDPSTAAAATAAVVSEGSEKNGPSVLDRLAFYEVAFTAMVAQQQLQRQDDQVQESTELSTRDRLAIIKSHRELAGTLFLNFKQQDYVEYLRILLDTCGMMCLEPEVLEDFIRILGVDPRLVPALLDGEDSGLENGQGGSTRGRAKANVGLSDYDLGCLVQFLGDYFVDCQARMAIGNLLDRYNGYTVSIASLLTAVLCDERYLTKWIKSFAETVGYSRPVIEKNPSGGAGQSGQLVNLSQCRMWHDTMMVFQPWLSCLTDQAVDEIRFQRQQSGASRMLFTFTGILIKMGKAVEYHYGEGAWSMMVSELFDFFLELTVQGAQGQGCVNQMMLIHQHFQRIEWKGLELTRPQVDRILEVKEHLNVETRVEFWTFLVTVLLEKVDTDLRPRSLVSKTGTVEWHQTEAAFLRLGLTILQDVQLVTGQDMDVQYQFLDRLWRVVFDAGDWSLVSTEELKVQVEGLKVHWERAGHWDDGSSPMGLLLYWMRIAVGLENTLAEEIEPGLQGVGMSFRGNSGAGECSRDLNVDRVLVYFNYVLQLLQSRLASSAQDSQNVNFRMDDIPIVMAHLGQVLDRIGGNRYLAKHPVIFRPLLALVGVLNQCAQQQQPESMASVLSAVASGAGTGSSISDQTTTFEVVLRGLRGMIGEMEVVHLDVVRVVCQKVYSISAMIHLLEGAIEREFYLWEGQQMQRGTLRRSRLDRAGATTTTTSLVASGAGSIFGLEEAPAAITSQEVSAVGDLENQEVTDNDISRASPSLPHPPPTSATPTPSSSLPSSPSSSSSPSLHGRQSWIKIKTQMLAPELSEEEFLDQGLKQGAILTIYGRFLQRLEECEASGSFDEVLGLGRELALVISKLDLAGLIGGGGGGDRKVMEPWKAYQSLLLVRMFLRLVAKESVHSILQSRFLNSIMQVCRTLEIWCQDRDSTKGMLSSIGMGTRSCLDIKFRLVVRIIYTYMVVRLADKSISIHTSNSGSGGWHRGRQSSFQSMGNVDEQPSSTSSSWSMSNGATGLSVKDAGVALVELLAQLPTKNKDYAQIFVAPTTAYTATNTSGALTLSAALPLPLDIVKRTLLGSSSSPPPSASAPSGRHSTSSPAPSSSPSPSGSTSGAGAKSMSTAMQKRLSFRSHHSRVSTGSSWDDSTFMFSHSSTGGISPSFMSSSTFAGITGAGPTTSTIPSATAYSLAVQKRARLIQGTRGKGVEDLEWAVGQIRDRRFRILEAAEVLEEVLERFYEGDGYFA